MQFKELLLLIAEAVYPTRCPICDSTLSLGKKELCSQCQDNVILENDHQCLRCSKKMVDSNKFICHDCQKEEMSYIKNFTLFYYDEQVRKSIIRFKNGNRAGYCHVFSKALYDKHQVEFNKLSIDFIVPVPLHYKKKLRRGYNQSYLIGKSLSKYLGCGIVQNILFKRNDSIDTKSLNRLERYRHLKNAFGVKHRHLLLNKTVLLVDDVYTTGSTVRILSRLLLENGCKAVYVATIAVGNEK